MSIDPEPISTDLVFRLVVTNGPDRAVNATLRYLPGDPYAVRIGFHTGSSEVVEWTFARSLLSDGVTHPVGDGDVQVWPTENTEEAGVCLALSSPSGRALFEASLPRIVAFLSQTYSVVPNGTESEYVNVEAELASLLQDDA